MKRLMILAAIAAALPTSPTSADEQANLRLFIETLNASQDYRLRLLVAGSFVACRKSLERADELMVVPLSKFSEDAARVLAAMNVAYILGVAAGATLMDEGVDRMQALCEASEDHATELLR